MQAIAAHLSPFRDRRDRDFGRDSRRQGCATGPLSGLAVANHDLSTINCHRHEASTQAHADTDTWPLCYVYHCHDGVRTNYLYM